MGAFSAAATGGDILESAIEGTLTGLAGTACGLLIANPFMAIGAAAVSGCVIDIGTQATSQYVKTGSVDISEIDKGRVAKTALYTGIGAAIKPLPGVEKNTYNNTKSVAKSTKCNTVQSKNNTCRITTTTADYFKQMYSGA